MSKDNFTLKEILIGLQGAVEELNKTVRVKQDCDAKHNKLDTRINMQNKLIWAIIVLFVTAFSFLASK